MSGYDMDDLGKDFEYHTDAQAEPAAQETPGHKRLWTPS